MKSTHAALLALALAAFMLSGPLLNAPDRPLADARYVYEDLGSLDPSTTSLLIAAPDLGYSDDDARALSAFLFNGGRVAMADNSRIGSELLVTLNTGIELTGVRVYSPSFTNSHRQVLSRNTGFAALGDEVVLTDPVLVRGGTPWLLTPLLSWADSNANGRPDIDESRVDGAFATHLAVGKGALLVVGDPAFSGSLEPFLREGGRTLVVDRAHTAGGDPFGVHPLLAGRLGTLSATGILMTALVLGALVVLGPRLKSDARPHVRPIRPNQRDPGLVASLLGELNEE